MVQGHSRKEFNPFEGPYTLDGVGGLLYGILNELSEIRKILVEYTALEGATLTNTFTLKSGDPVTKIDFEEARHAGVPNNVTFEVPLKKISTLKITNLGPANIFWSTNKGLSQFESSELLEAGETQDWLPVKKRSISQLNIVANNIPGADVIQKAKVRLTILV